MVERIFFSTWRPFAWVGLAVFLLYGRTIFFSEYTYLDDYYMIVDYQHLLTNPRHFLNAFTEDVFHTNQGGMYYRPILTVSLMVDALIGGTSPAVYRFSNIVYHILTAAFLIALLKELGFKNSFAFAASLIFAVHPAMTQAVVWIPGRNESLLSMFLLLSIIGMLRFQSSLRLRWYFVHLLFFALALLTKENALMAPALFVVLFFRKPRAEFSFAHYLLLGLGWFFIILYWVYGREAAMIMQLNDYRATITAISKNSWALLSFLGTTVWPWNLFTIAVAEDLSIIPGLVGLVCILGFFLYSKEKNWFLLMWGALWFALFLLPTFYRNPNALHPMRFFEHRVYLSFIGFLLMMAAGSLQTLWNRWRPASTLVLGLLFVALLVSSFRHSNSFADAMTFSEQTALTSPHSTFVHHEITMMELPPTFKASIVFSKRSAEPSTYYEKLKELEERLQHTNEPDHTTAEIHLNLGAIYFAMGRLKSAETELMQVLSLQPEHVIAQYNTGVLYYHGHFEKRAEQYWQKTIELDPSFADAYRNLCYLYYQWKEYSTAMQYAHLSEKFGASIPADLLNELRQLTNTN